MRDIGIYNVESVLLRMKRTVASLEEMRCETSLGEDRFFPETSEGVGRGLDRALRACPSLELTGSGADQSCK